MSGGTPRRRGATDGLDEVFDLSPGRFLHTIHALFYGKAFGLVLILLTGLLSLIGVLLPQKPSNIAGNPERQATWLDKVRGGTEGWTSILDALGFFSMFSSIPFLVVMELLAVSIIVCATHRIPVIWKAARHFHVRVKPRPFDVAGLRTRFFTSRELGDVLDAIVVDARRHGLRVIRDDKGPGRGAYLGHNAWMPFGTVLAHTVFVVIMAGFAVSSLTGFRDERSTLTIGYPRGAGHGTDLVAEATGFRDTYYENGTPKDYVANLALRDGDKTVAQQEVRVNSPLSHAGYMFYQTCSGVAAVMRVTDASGVVVFEGGVPLEWTTQDKVFSYGHVTLPSQTVMYVVSLASEQVGRGIAPGQMRVELRRGEKTTLLTSTVIDMGVATFAGDYSFTFQREQQFTGMILRNDPGTGIMWAGLALLVVSTCMTIFSRHQRLWVRVSETEEGTLVQVASPDWCGSGFTRFVTDMVERVSTQLTSTAKKGDQR